MEIKARLLKPYTKEQRMNFIVEYNHKQGLIIEETEKSLNALGYSASKISQSEAERIARLSLTKREVFLALYKDRGITPEQLRSQITDPEAVIEFDFANDYFRGNPLIDQIGIMLGYSVEDLDHLFETGSLPEKTEAEILTPEDISENETVDNESEEE